MIRYKVKTPPEQGGMRRWKGFHLRDLSQATGVRVLVEKDLVGHFLSDLTLGPLLLSVKTSKNKKDERDGARRKNEG